MAIFRRELVEDRQGHFFGCSQKGYIVAHECICRIGRIRGYIVVKVFIKVTL